MQLQRRYTQPIRILPNKRGGLRLDAWRFNDHDRYAVDMGMTRSSDGGVLPVENFEHGLAINFAVGADRRLEFGPAEAGNDAPDLPMAAFTNLSLVAVIDVQRARVDTFADRLSR